MHSNDVRLIRVLKSVQKLPSITIVKVILSSLPQWICISKLLIFQLFHLILQLLCKQIKKNMRGYILLERIVKEISRYLGWKWSNFLAIWSLKSQLNIMFLSFHLYEYIPAPLLKKLYSSCSSKKVFASDGYKFLNYKEIFLNIIKNI